MVSRQDAVLHGGASHAAAEMTCAQPPATTQGPCIVMSVGVQGVVHMGCYTSAHTQGTHCNAGTVCQRRASERRVSLLTLLCFPCFCSDATCFNVWEKVRQGHLKIPWTVTSPGHARACGACCPSFQRTLPGGGRNSSSKVFKGLSCQNMHSPSGSSQAGRTGLRPRTSCGDARPSGGMAPAHLSPGHCEWTCDLLFLALSSPHVTNCFMMIMLLCPLPICNNETCVQLRVCFVALGELETLFLPLASASPLSFSPLPLLQE